MFAALADPTRRRILTSAGRSPGCTSTALATELGITRQGVAKHLDVLEQANLLVRRRVGREARIDVEIRALEEVVGFVREVAGAQWDERLGRLADLFAPDGG
ncbi:MAG: transcriptional regulator, ArsR family [Thermoleophilia bacterium]|nr:transcriptional regulator, ArsR family [Thermoleophilia bacterium]MCW2925731.1 transcriptional regulator, ArsR family [Thermoleophilia bacterium]